MTTQPSMLDVDVEPPTYDNTVSDSRAQLSCGETPTLFLDKTTIFAHTSPPRALYELSNVVTDAKSLVYGVQKVVYRVSSEAGSDKVRTRLDHIYDFTQDPLKGLESFSMQLNDVTVIQGQMSSKRTYKEVYLMPGVSGWKVKDHFKVGDSAVHQMKHQDEIHWKNMKGEVVAIESIAKRDKEKKLLGMPQLDVILPMDHKELDLLVTSWMARLWRQSADETKDPMTWKDLMPTYLRDRELWDDKVTPREEKSTIAPAFVGICGTDLHEYLGGPNFCPSSRHPVTGDQIPVTLGHEFSGIIKEIGSDVKQEHLKIGLPCAVQPTIYCGKCAACKAGAENACHTGGFIGLSGWGGGLSEAVSVPADQVFPLPEGIPLELGALVEPLSVAWHAVSATTVTSESNVLVMGGGPIGLAAVLCLKAKGVSNIMVAEIATARQKFAKEFGAAHIIDPKSQDVMEEVMKITGGIGADVTLDCAGVPASVKAACMAVKTRGTVINVAIWEKEIPFNPNWVTWRESSYKSVLGYQKKDYQAVIENLRTGALKPASMITRKISLDDLVEHGIKALITDKDNQVKVLVDVGASL
ncbi:hypothetical protein JMJ77_0008360 [Colletotrichum scovillei]|uniref:L-arabinitol 4-dehydrogenase n=1 Tax=Colletotrichum scovillei TaxID=1209932 RepID=A0A9P7RI06_9PEZI|nr:hypothetical protein JMJ77_0008360 [Colletotrichum scovillei]KAH8421946.1 hypothetical protein JMJ76_0011742 [Colletotrichum scovillei]